MNLQCRSAAAIIVRFIGPATKSHGGKIEIDPLEIARTLWGQTHPKLVPEAVTQPEPQTAKPDDYPERK